MVGRVIVARLAPAAVYPLVLPQDPTLPAVTYRVISTIRQHAFGADSSIIETRVQVDSWGKTYTEARALGDEVITALSRFSGTVSGVVVHDIALDNEQELFEDDTDTRRISQDYIVFYS